MAAQAGENGFRGGIRPDNISIGADDSVALGPGGKPEKDKWTAEELEFMAKRATVLVFIFSPPYPALSSSTQQEVSGRVPEHMGTKRILTSPTVTYFLQAFM